jgi:pSer/pThr/pTyr-binding forkhead associated (FHA) protein
MGGVAMSHQVRIVSGPRAGTTILVSEQHPVFIGRDDACEVAIPEDNTLSRTHAEVIYESGEWYLRNKSQHGTLMGGEVFQDKRQIAEGTEFQVGATKIVFEFDPNPTAEETSDGPTRNAADIDAEAEAGLIVKKPTSKKWIVLGIVVALVLIGVGAAVLLKLAK